ncbi:MAG: PilZ domain-containing protein [Terriglobales bacterium]
MYLVIVCALLAVAVFLLMAGRGKSPRSRRKSTRIDLVIPVEMEASGERYPAESQNISQGGMLLNSEAPVNVTQSVQLTFTLPDKAPIEIPAVVCHKRGTLFGVKFDPAHQRLVVIDHWVRHAFEEEEDRRAAAKVSDQP